MYSQKSFSRFFCDASEPIPNEHTIGRCHVTSSQSLLGGVNRGQIIGELFLASYFKASYFGKLFLCKLDY